MRLQMRLLPITALALVMTATSGMAQAAERGRDGEGQVRGGRAHERARGDGGSGRAVPREDRRDGGREARQVAPRADRQADRQDDRRGDRGFGGIDRRPDRRNDRWAGRPEYRRDNRGDSWGRRDGYRVIVPRVYSPRVIVPRGPRYSPRRYYGPGGDLSVYFSWGSGYLFGSPYSGRVYGYSAPYRGYGPRRYYGDVRLQVRPRDAQVYVDGYYAGIVDDFDGVFQRLTLEVGPHEIEIAAPGLESQFFDIYVDAARTVDLHGDLYYDGR